MTASEFKSAFDLKKYVKDKTRYEYRGTDLYSLCPFHDDVKPSCCIHEHRFYCFSCSAHGSSIDYLVQVTGQSVSEILHSFANVGDVGEYKQNESNKCDDKEAASCNNLSLPFVLSASSLLHRQKQYKLYLNKRHLTDKCIGQAYIGLCKPMDFAKFKALRYTIPFFDVDNKLIGLRYRLVHDSYEPKYLAHPKTPSTLYNQKVLNCAGTVLLVGSQLDAAALTYSYGIPAVSSASENIFRPEWCTLFKNKCVHIQLDNDNTGITFAIKIYKMLKEHAKYVELYEWNNNFKKGADTKDLLDAYGDEYFRKIYNNLCQKH